MTDPIQIKQASEAKHEGAPGYGIEKTADYSIMSSHKGSMPRAAAVQANDRHTIPNVLGYAQAINTNNTCGPASMATVMDYYRFGWDDIPAGTDGHYENEAYVRRIMEWSGAPDIMGGAWGTSPMRIVDSMKRLNMDATWYANGSPDDTIGNIINEIRNNRPVYVLIDFGNFWLDWQVAFAYTSNTIVTKYSYEGRDRYRIWTFDELNRFMECGIPNCNRSFIVVIKK